MKKLLYSILSALLLMVSSLASAQYLNVKLEDGSVRSFKTTPNMKLSFGDKAGLELTESEQTVTVGDNKVTVKLAENTPASEVVFSTNLNLSIAEPQPIKDKVNSRAERLFDLFENFL